MTSNCEFTVCDFSCILVLLLCAFVWHHDTPTHLLMWLLVVDAQMVFFSTGSRHRLRMEADSIKR